MRIITQLSMTSILDILVYIIWYSTFYDINSLYIGQGLRKDYHNSSKRFVNNVLENNFVRSKSLALSESKNECKDDFLPLGLSSSSRVPFSLTALTSGTDASYAPLNRNFIKENTIFHPGPSSYQVLLKWESGPKRILLLSKPHPEINKAAAESVQFLLDRGIEVYVDETIYNYLVKNKLKEDILQKKPPNTLLPRIFTHTISNSIDLIVLFGGDGLIMHANAMFVEGGVPPTMCFDFGSLGFLAPYNYEDFEMEMTRILAGEILLTLRMRLQCSIIRAGRVCGTYHVLNEAVIDRGPSPFLSNLDLFCDDQLLTTVQADGLIISTPTGSTAYSLSAGGSMVHPTIPAFLLTPICAHTLSFRPLLLPDSCVLKCVVPMDCRANAWVSFDGKFRQELQGGDSLVISMSPYPMPTLNKNNFTADWFDALRSAFMFNQRPRQKSFFNNE